MDLFWKVTAAALVTSLLTLMLSKQQKDFSLLLTMAVCAMGLGILVAFLHPVLDFLQELQALGDLNVDMLAILLKAVGIGIVSEVASMTCTDAGNGSLGKMLQMLSAGAILSMSLPMFRMLLELITQILGEV